MKNKLSSALETGGVGVLLAIGLLFFVLCCSPLTLWKHTVWSSCAVLRLPSESIPFGDTRHSRLCAYVLEGSAGLNSPYKVAWENRVGTNKICQNKKLVHPSHKQSASRSTDHYRPGIRHVWTYAQLHSCRVTAIWYTLRPLRLFLVQSCRVRAGRRAMLIMPVQ